jgi:DNA-binding CsgD family transcriptional regulator
MANLKKTDILEAISDFLPLVKNLGIDTKEQFLETMLKMNDYGATYFGVRRIFANGQSALFSNNVRWLDIQQDIEFKKDFNTHATEELLAILGEKSFLVSRCGDKVNNPFLKKLQNYGVNNSILIYQILPHSHCIQIVYFMADPTETQARDLIVNNLSKLASLKNKLHSILEYIMNSKEFLSLQEPLIDRQVISDLWANQNLMNYLDLTNNNSFSLTNKEQEYLSLLNQGLRPKEIAEKLGISIATARNHNTNIRAKIHCSSTKSLQNITLMR